MNLKILFFLSSILLFPITQAFCQTKSTEKDKGSRTPVTFEGNKIKWLKKNVFGFSPGYTKSAYCSNTSEGTIPVLACDEIGTNSFNNSVYTTNLSSSQYVWNNAPTSNNSACQGLWAGNWNHFSLEPGADAINITFENASLYYGYNGYGPYISISIFQGSSCTNLTEISCNQVTYIDAFGYIYLEDLFVDGLNDNEDIWIYTSSDDDYLLTQVNIQGMTSPSNSTCTSAGLTNSGCNSGVEGDITWTGPNNNGQSCTGGTWYSNENTVFYTFTATETNASLGIENAICNDGISGEIQIGVWTDCASVGNYGSGSGFIGCAVGSGTLTMPALTVGETYVLVADGQAGDICKWDFVTDGIVLPVELINLEAQRLRDYNLVYWSTSSEYNTDYFIIERSLDGNNFEAIGEVDAAGTTDEIQNYSFQDFDQSNQTVYYRLKQFDQDGNFEYHGPRPLYYNGSGGLEISPNPTSNSSWLTFDFKNDKKYDVCIRDLSGREVFKNTIETTSIGFKGIELNLESYESGIYLVSVFEDGLPLGTKEVVKK